MPSSNYVPSSRWLAGSVAYIMPGSFFYLSAPAIGFVSAVSAGSGVSSFPIEEEETEFECKECGVVIKREQFQSFKRFYETLSANKLCNKCFNRKVSLVNLEPVETVLDPENGKNKRVDAMLEGLKK